MLMVDTFEIMRNSKATRACHKYELGHRILNTENRCFYDVTAEVMRTAFSWSYASIHKQIQDKYYIDFIPVTNLGLS